MNKTFALSALAIAISAPVMAQSTVVNMKQNRIIGGSDAPVAEYPWMVSVKSKGGAEHFCGASLIDKQWVLTAAHCVEEERADGIQVTVAEYDQNKADDGEQTLMVSDIYIHQEYGDDHDIALLKLAAESDKTPIALADSNFMVNLNVGTELTTIGWGLTKDGDDNSGAAVLQQVKVPLYDQANCKTNYGTLNIDISNNMVCAGLEAGGKDSCQGDSGGPLFVQSGGSMVQLGVTSFGEACAKAKFPGVYTRVAAYRDWVTSVKNGDVPAHQGPKPDTDGGHADWDGDWLEEDVLGLPQYVDLYVEQGEQSTSDELVLTNPADASTAIMVSDMTLSGSGFSLVDNQCLNQSIEAGKSCSFSVSYQPQQDKTYAEGGLKITTNHSEHSTIEVELFALNGDAFDEGDEVSCSIFVDLNIAEDEADLGGDMNCEDDFDGDFGDDELGDEDFTDDLNDDGGNDEDDDDNEATITVAGAINPFMLLGLVALPLLGRRRQ